MRGAHEDRALVVDCQVFQSQTWHHGMGQYSLALLRALANAGPDSYGRVHLVFNRLLPTPEDRIAVLRETWPGAAIDHVDLRHDGQSPQASRAANSQALDRYLEVSVRGPADFLVPAVFLGAGPAAAFPSSARKLLIFYDLIPYLFHERYAYLNRSHLDDYLTRFGLVYEADLILTISRSTADDLRVHLGIDSSKLANIDGAPIDIWRERGVRPQLAVDGPYVLAPTGGEQRKNIKRGAMGFERMAQGRSDGIRLLVTSVFNDDLRQELESVSDRVVFAGHTPSSELRWLYEHSEAVLFPSEYEGLGLPVLEGVAAGKPVACSDIAVFREMSPTAFYYFDPLDVDSIAQALKDAMDHREWERRRAEYPGLVSRYTWEGTAARFLDAVRPDPPRPPRRLPRRRVAVLAPDVTTDSADALLTLRLHSALAERWDLEYFFDRAGGTSEARPNPLLSAVPCHEARNFTAARYGEFDAVLYHVGGGAEHARVLLSALHLPGYVILHSGDLSGAYDAAARLGLMSTARVDLERLLDAGSVAPDAICLGSLLNAQLGAVVPDAVLDRAGRHWLSDEAGCLRLELPAIEPERATWDAPRQVMRVGVSFLGTTSPAAQLWRELAASAGTAFELIAVGAAPLNGDRELQDILGRLDVLVVPGACDSEAERMLIADAMGYGAVPAVENSRWCSGQTAAVVAGYSDRQELLALLTRMGADPEYRRRLGGAARSRARQLSYASYAERLIEFMEDSEAAAIAGPNRAQATEIRAEWQRRRPAG